VNSFAAVQLEASVSVGGSVPQVPRSIFRLRLVASSCLVVHCLGTSPSRNTMTSGQIRFGIGVWGSVCGRLY
jgi:hypothetical protein